MVKLTTSFHVDVLLPLVGGSRRRSGSVWDSASTPAQKCWFCASSAVTRSASTIPRWFYGIWPIDGSACETIAMISETASNETSAPHRRAAPSCPTVRSTRTGRARAAGGFGRGRAPPRLPREQAPKHELPRSPRPRCGSASRLDACSRRLQRPRGPSPILPWQHCPVPRRRSRTSAGMGGGPSHHMLPLIIQSPCLLSDFTGTMALGPRVDVEVTSRPIFSCSLRWIWRRTADLRMITGTCGRIGERRRTAGESCDA